jgi:hypothetical protein
MVGGPGIISKTGRRAEGRRFYHTAQAATPAPSNLPCTINVSVKRKPTFTYVKVRSNYLTQRVFNTELKEPRHV